MRGRAEEASRKAKRDRIPRGVGIYIGLTISLLFVALYFLLPVVSWADEQESGDSGDSTTITVEVTKGTPPSPPPTPPSPPAPPPKSDRTVPYTRIVPGPSGPRPPSVPIISVDAWGMALSPTTGRVDGKVDQMADCILHFGKREDELDIVIGPQRTSEDGYTVRYDLSDLTPNTKYYFKIEAHSLVHKGLVGWSPLRDFTTPGIPGGGVERGEGGGGNRVVGPPPGGHRIPWWAWLTPLAVPPFVILFYYKRLIGYITAPEDGLIWYRSGRYIGDIALVVVDNGREELRALTGGVAELEAREEPLFELKEWVESTERVMVAFCEWLLPEGAPEGAERTMGRFAVARNLEPLKPLKVLAEENTFVEKDAKLIKVRRRWKSLLRRKGEEKRAAEERGDLYATFYLWEYMPRPNGGGS